MVIDSSAIIAIFNDEPEAGEFLLKIAADGRRLVSAATLVELQMVMIRFAREEGLVALDAFMGRNNIHIVAFDRTQALVARTAFLSFGKGQHRAGLNFGDCMTYALAKQTGEPLLFKGDDFSQTDLLLA